MYICVSVDHDIISVVPGIFTPHTHVRTGGYIIGTGVHLYIYICICPPPPPPKKKCLNDTLAVDSPIQTLAVDFSSNLYTSSTTVPSSSLSKSRISLFNGHLASEG